MVSYQRGDSHFGSTCNSAWSVTGKGILILLERITIRGQLPRRGFSFYLNVYLCLVTYSGREQKTACLLPYDENGP